MWHKVDEKCSFVLSDLDGLCIEYCTEFNDSDGNKLFVPDSLISKFIEYYAFEDFD